MGPGLARGGRRQHPLWPETAGPGSPAQRSACLSHPHGPHPGGAEVVGAGAPQMGPHRLRCVLHPPHPLVLPRPLQVDRQTKAEDEPRVTEPEAPCEPPGDSCGLRLCSESLWKRRCSRNTLIPPETSKAQVRRGGLPPGLPPAPLGRWGSPGCSLSPGEGSGAGGRRPSHPVSPGPSSPWPQSLSGGGPRGWGRGRARSSSWEVSGAVAAGPGLGLGDRPTRPPERGTDGWPGGQARGAWATHPSPAAAAPACAHCPPRPRGW